MWSRDEYRQQPCTLYDIHLPPHGPTAHWLSDWEVDYSTDSTSAQSSSSLSSSSSSQQTPRYEEWPLARGSPSSLSGESPSRGQRRDSPDSLGSLEIIVTQSPLTANPTPAAPREFRAGIVYSGTEEGCVHPTSTCDDKGWQYASRLSAK